MYFEKKYIYDNEHVYLHNELCVSKTESTFTLLKKRLN